MLLSTHFMDEADVLGDRIAIMADGVLKTVGSPFFLKKTFSVGYRLICVKGPYCNRDLLCQILRNYIPDVRVETDIGSELSFVLKEDYIGVFQKMLEEFERRIAVCGITSFGISLTPMEEIFLKAGNDTLSETDHSNGTSIETTNQNYSLNNMNLLTGNDLLLSQIKGQFLKKMLFVGYANHPERDSNLLCHYVLCDCSKHFQRSRFTTVEDIFRSLQRNCDCIGRQRCN